MTEGNDRRQPVPDQAQLITHVRSELSRVMQLVQEEIVAGEHEYGVSPESGTSEHDLEDVMRTMCDDAFRIIVCLGQACMERSAAHDIRETARESLHSFKCSLNAYSVAADAYMKGGCATNPDLCRGYAPTRERSMDELRSMCLQPDVVKAGLYRMSMRSVMDSVPDLSDEDEAMRNERRELDALLVRMDSLKTHVTDAVVALRQLSGASLRMSEAELNTCDASDLRKRVLKFCAFARAALSEYSSRAHDARHGVCLPSDAREVMSLLTANVDLLTAELADGCGSRG